MTKLNYCNWYLDFNSIKSLNRRQYSDILELYRSMLYAADENREILAESYLNTLKNAGFVKNSTQENREIKISEIVDENI